LETIQIYQKNWERAERELLTQDRDRKIEILNREPSVEQDLMYTVQEHL